MGNKGLGLFKPKGGPPGTGRDIYRFTDGIIAVLTWDHSEGIL